MRVGELGRNIHWAVYDVEPADQKMELENRFWSQFFRYDSQNHTKGEFRKERMRTTVIVKVMVMVMLLLLMSIVIILASLGSYKKTP